MTRVSGRSVTFIGRIGVFFVFVFLEDADWVRVFWFVLATEVAFLRGAFEGWVEGDRFFLVGGGWFVGEVVESKGAGNSVPCVYLGRKIIKLDASSKVLLIGL